MSMTACYVSDSALLSQGFKSRTRFTTQSQVFNLMTKKLKINQLMNINLYSFMPCTMYSWSVSVYVLL